MLWTRWDSRQLARAALAAALALGLAWLVTAATDEGGIGWGEKAGRTLPVAPVCGAAGAWAALAPVRWRGEVLALEALGRSRAQIAAAAALGGALVAVVSAMVLGTVRAVDVTGFFPVATHTNAWTWEVGAFVDRLHGLRVAADGTAALIGPDVGAVRSGVPAFGRASAALATALAGLALPLLLTRALLARARALPIALGAGAAAAATVVSFQAAAAHRVPALIGVLPALTLLAFALRRYPV